MVKNRQAIRELGFAAPAGIPRGVEVLSLAQFRSRVVSGPPQRPTFHHLLTIERGSLRHTVDFTGYTVASGGWLWVRPGQVQQWGELGDVGGTLILFEPDFLDSGTVTAARLRDAHAPVVYQPAEDDRQRLTDAIVHLTRAFEAPGSLPLDIRQIVLRHLLAVLLLRLAFVPGDSAPEPSDTFLRFRDAVEHAFVRTRRLEDYARLLGYSSRTLSRATRAAVGINAKDFIDQRAVLEAKRLLAHSDQTAAQVAARLGFSSATNFTKYFHQRTGTTPIAFRAALRG
ncbi:helix-turn-helix domain-containing protein [Cryptosporangium arvum]|uniref:DNA-binding domain-containing protein, AraC-type n=1 Tax=Cryptosporangium arvum DSM 44712 TaxID=927661 RepID=A0A010ZXV1_9ACTN|nr:DNA-binding domain-containing protein, AraC-type [Cryptosporangium arvum DSM 44712]